MTTALEVPRRSPTQVLAEPHRTYLRRVNRKRCFHDALAVVETVCVSSISYTLVATGVVHSESCAVFT